VIGSDAPRPRRRGRPAGAPPNKAAILAAARHEFIEHGYGATIRGIAARAGVDPALVLHYFGSKDQLLLAGLQAGGADEPSVADALPGLLAGDPDRLGERLVRSTVSAYESPFFRAAWGSIVGLLRLAATQPEAAAMLRAGFMDGGLVLLLEATDVSQPHTRAALIASALGGLALARLVLGLEPIASATIEELVAWYGPTVQRYLTGPLA
jgi:AcrR family transcriptional regulator